jgi:phospholipid/cholesterol/gamma-HCH transport system ATP-binding protein
MSSAASAPGESAAGETPAIAVRELECRQGESVILRDVTFEVAPGELFFVVGGSGCGKSTLLKHLIGLLPVAHGQVAYFGRDFTGAPPAERRALQRQFGVLYQNGALWSSLTLGENVALPLEEHTALTRAERLEIVRWKLEQVGLAGYEDYYPAEISGGMRKRAALARALALDPRIVFFDEPAAGLDPITTRHLDRLILQIRDNLGTTMVIVSHELESILGIADRLVLLHRDVAGVLAAGRPHDLRNHPPDPRVREFLAPDPVVNTSPSSRSSSRAHS